MLKATACSLTITANQARGFVRSSVESPQPQFRNSPAAEFLRFRNTPGASGRPDDLRYRKTRCIRPGLLPALVGRPHTLRIHNLAFQYLSWFLALMLDAASVGIYSACMMCIQVMNPFLLGLNSLLVPKTAHAYAEEGVSGLKSKVRWTTFCLGGATGVFAIVASIWGPSVLEYIYRAQAFEIPTPVVAALTFGLFIEICGTGPENGLWAMERHDLNFRAEIIAAVVSVLGACYLIWSFGLVGAALSFLVGRTLTSVSHWIAFRHAIKSQTA